MVDFGAQYAQLIARRVREAASTREIVPHTMPRRRDGRPRIPAAIILSGGPSSVYAEGAPQLDPALFEIGVPVFGICYGFQAMAQALGGDVAHTGRREYGRRTDRRRPETCLRGLPDEQPVWMSHGDSVTAAPAGFRRAASTAGAPVAAFENRRRAAGRRAVPPGGACTPRTGSGC